MRRCGKEEKRERQRAMEGFYKNAALVRQKRIFTDSIKTVGRESKTGSWSYFLDYEL